MSGNSGLVTFKVGSQVCSGSSRFQNEMPCPSKYVVALGEKSFESAIGGSEPWQTGSERRWPKAAARLERKLGAASFWFRGLFLKDTPLTWGINRQSLLSRRLGRTCLLHQINFCLYASIFYCREEEKNKNGRLFQTLDGDLLIFWKTSGKSIGRKCESS